MDLLKIIIKTKRLKLIPTSGKYSQEIFREFTDEITNFMIPKTAKKIEETLSFIRTSRNKMKKREEMQVVILNKHTNEFLGHGGAHGLNTDTPSLGIWIKKSAHNHKYGREAIHGLKDWIDKNFTYKYIKYSCEKRNIGSRKIAESLGGTIIAEYKKTSMPGKELNYIEYRIYPISKTSISILR
jgi:ribosomal-protein-alanine N-acetyltransferase